MNKATGNEFGCVGKDCEQKLQNAVNSAVEKLLKKTRERKVEEDKGAEDKKKAEEREERRRSEMFLAL